MKDIPTKNNSNENSEDFAAQQNDENKNIITLDDNNQNKLSNTANEIIAHDGVGIVKTALAPGQVVRRKKSSTTPPKRQEIDSIEIMTNSSASDADSTEMTTSQTEVPMPEWVVVGESVLIRPYNTSGVISFIGATHFQVNLFELFFFFLFIF